MAGKGRTKETKSKTEKGRRESKREQEREEVRGKESEFCFQRGGQCVTNPRKGRKGWEEVREKVQIQENKGRGGKKRGKRTTA